MFFYYRKRLTGWGPERAMEHPEHAYKKFRYTGLVELKDPYDTFNLCSLEVCYPFVDPDIIIVDEATEITEEQYEFVTRRVKEQNDA